MGLFSSGADDAATGLRILNVGLRRFNGSVGIAYGVEVLIDEKLLAECSAVFERITAIGFPPDPGPFKRLGAFATLAQVFRPFVIKPSIEASILPPETEIVWGARLVVWLLPVFAGALEINHDDNGPGIGDILLPTPHFQVEFIAYLRNMANGATDLKFRPDDHLLLERATATGLMLEACAYIPKRVDHKDACFYAKAAACLEAIAQDPLLLDDWKFNDPEFLELATGLGTD